jgi:hypothetical protein
MNWDGAAPFLMTQATFGGSLDPDCADIPLNLATTPGQTQVNLEWSAVAYATGYKVYYDQAGKAQLVADAGNSTTYLDGGLTNGVEYCYKVTAYDVNCESGYSNIICATPQNQGQSGPVAGVDSMQTGFYSGKGKNQTFNITDTFAAGDSVVIRARVLDSADLPVSNATVEITIGGPETTTLNTGPSDVEGWAEVTWKTQAPNRKGQGGTTPGDYTATTTNVTASGYNWDKITTSTTFNVQ